MLGTVGNWGPSLPLLATTATFEVGIGSVPPPNFTAARTGFRLRPLTPSSFVGITTGVFAPLCEVAICGLSVGIEVSPVTGDNDCLTEVTGAVPAGPCFDGCKASTRDVFIRLPGRPSDGECGGDRKGPVPIEGDAMLSGLLEWSKRVAREVLVPAASVGVFKGCDTVFGAPDHRGVSSRLLSNTPAVGGKRDG